MINAGYETYTIHRLFAGNHASLLAMFSLFELFHNLPNLIEASKGNDTYKRAVNWYENNLKSLEQGKLCFRPEVKSYIKKWYMSEKKWEKILDDARKECLIMLHDKKIINTIENLLEKARNSGKFE